MPKATKSKYSPHPALGREQRGRQQILDASGRSFDDWVSLSRKKGPKTQKDCSKWLREEHGLRSMHAWWVASTATTPDDEASYDEPEALVDALYSGPKKPLRPLHEKVVDAALALGGDVLATSCKTMVPLYRKHVFAELRPVSDAVELSLALGEKAKGARFETVSRNAGDRLTHRVLLRSPSDLDAEFHAALRAAYDQGAGKIARAEKAKTPADLAKALKASAKATTTWDSCTDAMRRDWIVWVESAKQAETRERRVGRSIDLLAAGKKKIY